ncbi:MAG TPA: hypothetical protein VFY06_00750 [Verrucomicrobiae bacterium]|nr:hypothetical protein [Verrucomicrobiae bacterium]
MSKLLWTVSVFLLCGLLKATAADSFSLADGSTVTGVIVSFNDNGIIFRTGDDKYTDRLPWLKFSQDGLKKLAENPKIAPFVEPFIIPAQTQPPPKPGIKVGEVRRLDRSSPASLFGGLFSAPVSLVMLLLIYAANIYAGYEVALFRARPVGLVTGVAAVLPVVGPIIFLSMPDLRSTPATATRPAAEQPVQTPTGAPAESASTTNEPHRFTVPGAQAEPAKPGLHLATGSWEAGAPAAPAEERQTEIFQRGQFMFNRRFFETKFSGFFGVVRREADKDKVLQVRTSSTLLVAERITRIAANEVHFEVLRGDSRQEIMVPFAEIQEVQLKHKQS